MDIVLFEKIFIFRSQSEARSSSLLPPCREVVGLLFFTVFSFLLLIHSLLSFLLLYLHWYNTFSMVMLLAAQIQSSQLLPYPVLYSHVIVFEMWVLCHHLIPLGPRFTQTSCLSLNIKQWNASQAFWPNLAACGTHFGSSTVWLV